MIQTSITFFGQPATVYCDGCCSQAWGLNSRPRVEVDGKDMWIADGEQQAPADPGTYEGDCGKPQTDEAKHNKWCTRECERSTMVRPNEEVKLPDWTVRAEC